MIVPDGDLRVSRAPVFTMFFGKFASPKLSTPAFSCMLFPLR